jgi:hypothetical protein
MKVYLRKAWAGLRAGVTTPDAVKAEKAVGVIVATRILIAVGATDALVQLVTKLINSA